MGREFLDLFEQWADYYDTTVDGHDEEYQAVFAGYEDILKAVADKAFGNVMEFGVGTGNLTIELINRGMRIYGVEPSAPMREKALEKLPQGTIIKDGDFLDFPKPDFAIDSIVSTYAFHHLTDEEKGKAFSLYGKLLQSGGKIVFADTSFENQRAFSDTIEQAKQKGYLNLAEDLQTEYYTTLEVLEKIAHDHGFSTAFTRCNQFVWIMEATKL